MEDLVVFTVLNHSGSFGRNLVKYKKKVVIHERRSVRTGKTVPTDGIKKSVIKLVGKRSKNRL